MNAQSIINDLSLSRDEKQIFMFLARIFDEHTPQSLYLDYYELAEGREDEVDPKNYYPGNKGTTPEQWEQFLEIPEIYRYRHGKIAKLMEYDAIKALQSLKGKADVSALKEIIKHSKALQGNGNNKEKIILTYVRPKQREAVN